jgi:hypothetical protein
MTYFTKIITRSFIPYYSQCINNTIKSTPYTVVTLVNELNPDIWKTHEILCSDNKIHGLLSCCEDVKWFHIPNIYLQKNLNPDTEAVFKRFYELTTGLKIEIVHPKYNDNLYGFMYRSVHNNV